MSDRTYAEKQKEKLSHRGPLAWMALNPVLANLLMIVVFVGGIHPWTRLELVIAAMAKIPDATLTVIGDGKRLDELKQLAQTNGVSDRVSFLGRLPHTEIPEHMVRHAIGLGNLEPDGVDAGAALKVVVTT